MPCWSMAGNGQVANLMRQRTWCVATSRLQPCGMMACPRMFYWLMTMQGGLDGEDCPGLFPCQLVSFMPLHLLTVSNPSSLSSLCLFSSSSFIFSRHSRLMIRSCLFADSFISPLCDPLFFFFFTCGCTCRTGSDVKSARCLSEPLARMGCSSPPSCHLAPGTSPLPSSLPFFLVWLACVWRVRRGSRRITIRYGNRSKGSSWWRPRRFVRDLMSHIGNECPGNGNDGMEHGRRIVAGHGRWPWSLAWSLKPRKAMSTKTEDSSRSH